MVFARKTMKFLNILVPMCHAVMLEASFYGAFWHFATAITGYVFYCVERKSNGFERPWECVNDERILTFGQTITLNNVRREVVRTEWIGQDPALGWACSMYSVSLCCFAFSCCFCHWLPGQWWRLTGVGYNPDRTRECLQYTFYANTH